MDLQILRSCQCRLSRSWRNKGLLEVGRNEVLTGAGSWRPPGQLLPENHGLGHMTTTSLTRVASWSSLVQLSVPTIIYDNVDVVDKDSASLMGNPSENDIQIIFKFLFSFCKIHYQSFHANEYLHLHFVFSLVVLVVAHDPEVGAWRARHALRSDGKPAKTQPIIWSLQDPTFPWCHFLIRTRSWVNFALSYFAGALEKTR